MSDPAANDTAGPDEDHRWPEHFTCPECGFSYDSVSQGDAVVAVRSFPRRYREALAGPADDPAWDRIVRRRPSAEREHVDARRRRRLFAEPDFTVRGEATLDPDHGLTFSDGCTQRFRAPRAEPRPHASIFSIGIPRA